VMQVIEKANPIGKDFPFEIEFFKNSFSAK
jgi:hypothetical protein